MSIAASKPKRAIKECWFAVPRAWFLAQLGCTHVPPSEDLFFLHEFFVHSPFVASVACFRCTQNLGVMPQNDQHSDHFYLFSGGLAVPVFQPPVDGWILAMSGVGPRVLYALPLGQVSKF